MILQIELIIYIIKSGDKMLENKKLAENIKKYRIKSKLTQTELAEKIFVSCQAVSKWERGVSFPELDKVCLLSDVFGVSIDVLIGKEENNNIYLVGVDGGGSKTEFMLFDNDGKVYKKITLGGCNPNASGFDNSLIVLKEGISNLMAVKSNIKGIYIGASGFKTGNNGDKIKKMLSKEYPFTKIDCGTDILNVISSSRIKENCIASICGTGTVVYAYKNKELIQYTGWGYLFDKGGSGYHIGRDAITAALEDRDNLGEKTLIRNLIEENTGKDIRDSIKEFYEKGQNYIASFASCVFKAYLQGDKKATEILENNAERTAFVLNEVKKQNPEFNKAILSGSIFVNDDIYLNTVKKYLDKDIETVKVKLHQVYGVALLAAEMCSLDTEKIYNSFINNQAEG